MANGYTRSPKLLKGAFVKLSEEFLVPVPSIIVFQYNPETVTRTLTPYTSSTQEGETQGGETLAEPFDPQETISLTLELDAADALEDPDSHPTAVLAGVADRIAALEMLLYPSGDTGGLLGEAISSLLGAADVVPRNSVPVVLFVWGPGYIVPVRLTSFQVEEEAFSPTLYPIRAKVTVEMRVLTEQAFNKPDRDMSASEKIAVAAYKYTRTQKEVLAVANLANSVESILGMLPF